MAGLPEYLSRVLLTLWLGGLWVIGYVVAPVLFWKLPDKQLAGNLAGVLFGIMSWIGMASGFYLLIFRVVRHGARALKQWFFWIVLVMLLMVLGGYFGIQPVIQHLKQAALPREVMQSAFASRFERWHGIASVIYLIESLLGLLLFREREA